MSRSPGPMSASRRPPHNPPKRRLDGRPETVDEQGPSLLGGGPGRDHRGQVHRPPPELTLHRLLQLLVQPIGVEVDLLQHGVDHRAEGCPGREIGQRARRTATAGRGLVRSRSKTGHPPRRSGRPLLLVPGPPVGHRRVVGVEAPDRGMVDDGRERPPLAPPVREAVQRGHAELRLGPVGGRWRPPLQSSRRLADHTHGSPCPRLPPPGDRSGPPPPGRPGPRPSPRRTPPGRWPPRGGRTAHGPGPTLHSASPGPTTPRSGAGPGSWPRTAGGAARRPTRRRPAGDGPGARPRPATRPHRTGRRSAAPSRDPRRPPARSRGVAATGWAGTPPGTRGPWPPTPS